jgi:hypothetical protein
MIDTRRGVVMMRSALRAGLVAAAATLTACAAADAPPAAAGPERSGDWDAALTYAEFVRGDTANQALWRENTRLGAPADLVARARDAGGNWRLLVLAESWCSDAVYAVPFLAALADSVAGLEMRVLRTDGNEHLFAGHERNGRAAHPLVLVLDADGRERAGWVERPAELAAWIDARRGILPDDDLRLYRRGWYAGNGGRAAIAEVLDLVDSVRAGRTPPPVSAVAAGPEREVTPCPSPGE